MKHLTKIMLGLALLAALCSSLSAAEHEFTESAYQYYSECHNSFIIPHQGPQASDQVITDARCVWFASGMFEGLIMVSATAHSLTGHDLYDPQGHTIPLGQKMMILDKFMADNPQRLSEPTLVLALDAMTKAYPPK